MITNILPKLGITSQSVSKMLEDVRLLLGLSQEELLSALILLEKADYGSLNFVRDNIDIKLQSHSSLISSHNDISVEIAVKEEEIKHTIEYQVPRSVLKQLKVAKRKEATFAKKREVR